MTKNISKIVLAAVCSLGGFATVVSATTAQVKHPTYALGAAKHCKVHYVKKTETHKVTVHVKVNGKMVTKKVSRRYTACVYFVPIKLVAPVTVAPVVAVTAPIVTATAPTTTIPVVTTTTVPVTTTTSTTTTTTTTTVPPKPTPTINVVSYDTSTPGLNGTIMPNPLVLVEQLGAGVGDGPGVGLDLWVNATGSVPRDSTPTGILSFDISPAPAEQLAIWNNPNGTAGPQDCSNVVNAPTVLQPPAAPITSSGCMIYFSTPGTYTISITFVSSDPHYASVTNPYTLTVDITS